MRFSRDATGHCLLLSQPERELTVEAIQSKLQAVSKCWSPPTPAYLGRGPHHAVWSSLAPVSWIPSHRPGAALQAQPPPTSQMSKVTLREATRHTRGEG